MKFASLLVASAALSILSLANASAEVVTPTDLKGWTPANVRANATVDISDTYKPAGETGSLEFTTNTIVNGQDKADFAHALNGTLGQLVNGGSVNYNYYVDSSSTTAAHFAPALRFLFLDEATSKSGYLIYEPIYNGVNDVQNNTWVNNDITGANFWMRAFGAPSFTVERFDVTLAEWAGGYNEGGAHQLSSNTRILGVEVGVGSGWGNSFNGAVDHVNVDFGTANLTGGVSANFEATAAVPEPATWALMIGGFGMAGAVLRRRRLAVA